MLSKSNDNRNRGLRAVPRRVLAQRAAASTLFVYRDAAAYVFAGELRLSEQVFCAA